MHGNSLLIGKVELGVFAVFSLLLVYCLAHAYLRHPGKVPEDWTGSTLERKVDGSERTCKWCNKAKPDRTHHCSRCETCVLRMDHHCPWINNCIGHRNIKFFCLAILYGALDSLFISLTSVDTIIHYQRVSPGNIRLHELWMFSCMYCLNVVLTCLLSFYSTYMFINCCRNRTTLELCEKLRPVRQAIAVNWDVGPYQNLSQVLGPSIWLWFLPIDYGRGDGTSFPVNEESQRINS